MQKDTIFRIYSMTKPITGVAMMMLFEEGKWQLNDPVSKHIPEFANLKVAKVNPQSGAVTQVAPDHPMTMRELMSHSGGLTYGVFGSTAVDKMYTRRRTCSIATQPLQAMIDKLAKIPLLHPAGRALALQRVGRRAGLPRREAVGSAVPGIPEEAHLRAARHEGHRVLRAGGEAESLRVVLHLRQGPQVRAAPEPGLLEGRRRCLRAAAAWSRPRPTTCASARCC